MKPTLPISLSRFALAAAVAALAACSTDRRVTRLAPVGPDSPSSRMAVASSPRWFVPAGDDRVFNASAGGWERPPPFGPRLNN